MLSVHQDLFLAETTVDYHINTYFQSVSILPIEIPERHICFIPALLLIQSPHILSHCLRLCTYFLPQLVIQEDNGGVALM